jgi:hypothetical protein
MVAFYGANGQATATVLPFGVFSMRGTYAGTLPCSDCAGVWTEVILEDPGTNAGRGSGDFKMIERFTGGAGGETTIVSRGMWFVVNHRTDGYYQDSGTIELVPKRPDGTLANPRFFLCVLGQKLETLNSAMQPVTSDGPHALYRVLNIDDRT